MTLFILSYASDLLRRTKDDKNYRKAVTKLTTMNFRLYRLTALYATTNLRSCDRQVANRRPTYNERTRD